MKRAISMEAVRRTPRLQIDKRRVCGELKIERLGKKEHVYDVVNKLEEGCVVRTKSNHDKEFGNNKFNKFCFPKKRVMKSSLL